MNYHTQRTVTAGTSTVIVLPSDLDSLPISLQITPVSGGTAETFISCDSQETLENDVSNASWTSLSPASVTASYVYSITTPISAVKVTATTQNAVVNIKTYDVRIW